MSALPPRYIKSLENLALRDSRLEQRGKSLLDRRGKYGRERGADGFKMPRLCDIQAHVLFSPKSGVKVGVLGPSSAGLQSPPESTSSQYGNMINSRIASQSFDLASRPSQPGFDIGALKSGIQKKLLVNINSSR